MILQPERGLVVVTPPKTGSASLHKFLAGLGGQVFYGPHPSGPGYSKHSPHIPDEALAFPRVCLTIRDPWDRLVSLFHHFNGWENHEGRAGLSFADFASSVVNAWPVVLPWFYSIRAVDYAANLTAAGLAFELWALETIPHHLTSAECSAEPGHLLTVERYSYRNRTAAYYGPSILELVAPWATADANLLAAALDRQATAAACGPLRPGAYWNLPQPRPVYGPPTP